MATVVGIREMRQNLSAYLRRVEQGEVFDITDHGRRIATLGPATESQDPMERWLAEGRAIPPQAPRSPFPRVQPDPPDLLSKSLQELRDAEYAD